MVQCMNEYCIQKLKQQKILITRPQQQAPALIEAITKHGAECIALPCIEIVPISPALDTVASTYFDCSIITSCNAVRADLADTLQQATLRIAIGPATSAALQALGLSCITPTLYNSEGILALPQMQNVQGKQIAIYTGENPNPTLQHVLQQRGAQINMLLCYKRVCPHYTQQHLERITHTAFDYLIVNSYDALQNLVALFAKQHHWLRQQTLIVISDALHATATAMGFKHIHQATNASTAAIMECLLAIIP